MRVLVLGLGLLAACAADPTFTPIPHETTPTAPPAPASSGGQSPPLATIGEPADAEAPSTTIEATPEYDGGDPSLEEWVDQHRGSGEEVSAGRRRLDLDENTQFMTVVLVGAGGGNGTEVWLLALRNQRVHAFRNLAPDTSRPIVIDAISGDAEQLKLSIRRVGSGDAWCCPSQKGQLRYRLRDATWEPLAE